MSSPDTPQTPSAGWIRRLFGYVKRHRGDALISLIAAVLGTSGQIVVPLFARHIVDDVIIAHNSALWPWLTALVVVAVVVFFLAFLRRFLGGRLALKVQYDLRNDMHDHLLRMDQQTLAGLPTGQLVSRANSDSTLVQGLFNFLPLMTGNLLTMVLSLAVMFVLSPPLAAMALLIAPLLFLASYRLRRAVFPATWHAQQVEGDIAGIVDEDVTGVRVVKAFGQEGRELQRMVRASEDLYGSRLRSVRLQAKYQPILETIPVLGQVGVLAFGGWLALHGHISIGTFLAFSTYVAQLVAPARQLAGLLTVGQQARAGVERIFGLLDLQPAIVDPPDALTLTDIRGAVELRGVSLEVDEAPILDEVSLRVEPGERVAIVGPSGSGKSMLVSLLPRFYDVTSGAVLVDGQDVRTLSIASLRRHIGMAFEDSFLFSDTIAANIGYGRPDASREDIERAARIAGAHEFVTDLPRGYETTVGERGLSLSGGQRQRIALARTILSDPAILVLDDATSAVDATTEQQIHDGLREVLDGRTTILIAHRVSTLHLADRVVLMRDGRIVDQGGHEELAERNDEYRTLLAGLDADVNDEFAAEIGDSIEALAGFDTATPGGVTEAAWQAVRTKRHGPAVAVGGSASLGPGLGGGGGWKVNLAATPEILAQVDRLPPVRDTPQIDLARDTSVDPDFTLGRLLRQFRRPLLVGLLLVVLDAVAGLLGPVLVKIGVDNGVARGSLGVLFAASAVFLAITLADLVDQVAETFVTGRTAEQIMLSLRLRIWAQLQRLGLDFYEREMAGRIMTRMTTDVDQFEQLMANGLLAALVSVVTFVGVAVVLLLVNLELALWTLTVVIPLAIATLIFRRLSARRYDEARERIAIVNADFQESLSGVREAQAFTHEAQTSAQFHRLGQDYVDSRVGAQRIVATYFPFVLFLSSIADVIVLGVGARLIGSGSLTAGDLIAFILYINMFFAPIQQLSQVFDSWQQTRVSVARIADVMRLTTITPEPVRPVAPGNLRGEIVLDDVHFRYPAATPVLSELRGPADAPDLTADVGAAPVPEALRGISLRIEAGETVALVGQTGAGKSTVMKLIARFYDPDSGTVRIDGHDLRELDLGDYRRRLGYVPQEAYLFTGTVRDNIAYGRPEATDAEVEAAARSVGAHEFIAALPGGYLQEVSSTGRTLSAGQRQLIALARANLVDPVVLLLDEATANLDLATEARVNAAMEYVSRERTTLLIAHRLQTARTADRIVVLDSGGIAESGSHDELLALDGRYAQMWRAFELVGRAA